MIKISYNPVCHGTGNQQGDYRFALEQAGTRMIFVIGLNPSTADEKRPDRTMSKVIGFVERNDYDGFIMFNLSAERRTNKYLMSENLNANRHKENLGWMKQMSDKYPNADILVAFGNDINIKPYLKFCFSDIINVFTSGNRRWLKIGELTAKGNPRHPLYAKYDWKFTEMDISDFR